MSIGTRASVTAGMMPVVALALWATGGAHSYLQPVLLFTALFIAYFFPPRLAWPLVALFCGAFFSPLAYDPQAIELGYPARGVSSSWPSPGRRSRCTTSSTACWRPRPSSAAWRSATR